MAKELVIKVETLQDYPGAIERVKNAATKGVESGRPFEIALRYVEDLRSQSQNKKLWPMLSDISKQVDWLVNGSMGKLTPEDWKDILSAGLDSEQRVAPGINGGFVMLGRRTSKMRKKEFIDLIELIYAFGIQQGVTWSEPALAVYDEYREASQ